MTKQEAEQRQRYYSQLIDAGFSFDECEKLRRISLTLRRWFELECGDSNDWASWAIERDDNGEGRPFMIEHRYPRNGQEGRTIKTPVPDREAGARRRLAKILKDRNERNGSEVNSYIQGDPRGAALYILRPGDIPEGCTADQYHNRGVCIF